MKIKQQRKDEAELPTFPPIAMVCFMLVFGEKKLPHCLKMFADL